MYQNQGFTLIELLVVVLIIGILSSVAVPQYTKAVEKSYVAEAKTLLRNLSNAEDLYKLSTGTETLNLGDLDITFPDEHMNTVTGAIRTKNFTIYARNGTCSADGSSGNCMIFEATRIGKGYSVRFVGPAYGGGQTHGIFYCQPTSMPCSTKMGAVKNGDDWIFP